MEVTYEQEAKTAVLDFHDRKDRNPDAMVNYAMVFLIDYERALNQPGRGADQFLDAYAYRALAILNGASEQALDEQAYHIRQEWHEASKKG